MSKHFVAGWPEPITHTADPSLWSPPPTWAGLTGQVRDVIDDLPRFPAAPLQRRWHQTWGATQAEVAAEMPGDRLLPRAQYRCTRAITIGASPEKVWPWLVQVGCLRGGWYADDLLDNFARPSVRRIVPELQDLQVGQWLAWVPKPSERTAFVVDSFARPSWLLWRSPNRTWAWRLIPHGSQRTRLIARMHTVYEWRRPLALGTVLLMELADYPMMRRMLLGIRERAEAEQALAPEPGLRPLRAVGVLSLRRIRRELAQLPVRVGRAQALFNVQEGGQLTQVHRWSGVEFVRVNRDAHAIPVLELQSVGGRQGQRAEVISARRSADLAGVAHVAPFGPGTVMFAAVKCAAAPKSWTGYSAGYEAAGGTGASGDQ